MNHILHYISIVGVWMVLYGGLYLILKGLFGWVPFIKNTTIYGIPIEVPLFSILVVIFILTCVKISSPYAE